MRIDLLQFAEVFKRHPGTVRYWIYKGLIKPKKMPRPGEKKKILMFSENDIERIRRYLLWKK